MRAARAGDIMGVIGDVRRPPLPSVDRPMTNTVRRLGRAVALASLPLAAACATTGATLGSGVGDRRLERPPYYAGATVTPGAARVARLPVAYQRGAAQSPIFEPEGGRGTPVAALLGEMNAYLDSLDVGVRVTATLTGTPPDVRFGCETDAAGDCVERDPNAGPLQPGDDPGLWLAVGRPSPEWVAAVAPALASVGAERVLLVTLELGQYRVTSTGWRNDKSIELGTGHSAKLPWLTSLEAPVQVLQLTGALVGADGRAVRIGAEGLLARRTGLVMSGFGAQALITDEDVERLRTLRRDDLPGRPLAWQVALRALVAQLAGATA